MAIFQGKSRVFGDFIRESGIHAHDNTIGWFDMLESEFERSLYFVISLAHPACRQYLEAQAGLVNLPDYFGHGHRIS